MALQAPGVIPVARRSSGLKGALFVWSRYIAIALMLAYAMSFGLEISMNAWLPGYFARGFHAQILALGFTGVAGMQIAAGTFALVPLLFPQRPGLAAGFIGGLFTAAAIAYPLIFAGESNIHAGYLHVALAMFVPFVVFYFWAARYEHHPEEHGVFFAVAANEAAGE